MIYAENILLCIAIPLAVSLLFIRGESRRFVGAFLLGMGMCLLGAYISGFLNLVTGMGENDTAIFISPIVEEILKLFPLLFFLAVFEPEDRSLTMLAVAIGAGFATFENCCYILTSGAESLPSLIFSYRPGKKMMTIVESAKCRSDEAMRPANHVMAHERPLASFIESGWGVETVRLIGERKLEGALFHSVACNGAVSWNGEAYKIASTLGIPLIANVVDAHQSSDISGVCDPKAGKVLGCFGEPVVTKDRRIGAREMNYRLRKAAGTGSARPSSVTVWDGAKKTLDMTGISVASTQKTDKGVYGVIGLDLEALDSQKTLDAAWKAVMGE